MPPAEDCCRFTRAFCENAHNCLYSLDGYRHTKEVPISIFAKVDVCAHAIECNLDTCRSCNLRRACPFPANCWVLHHRGRIGRIV